MKKIILALFITLFALPIIAQTKDVIHLKNGSMIKGQIKEMNPSGNIKIETSDGSVFVYKMTEVVKMVKEEVSKPTPSNNISSNKLSRAEAERRIKSVYGYPKDQLWRVTVDDGSATWHMVKADNKKFVDAGLMKDNDPSGQKFLSQHYYAELTPKGEVYRRSEKYSNGRLIDLKIAEYEFVKITGILQEPNSNKAYVNYTVRRVNLNPLGKLILYHINKTKHKRYKNLLIEGEIINKRASLIRYDDGWRVIEDDEIRKMSRYVNKKKEFEKAGDYKKPDIAAFKPALTYLKAKDIPVFNEVNSLYLIMKSPGKCTDCRNDNIKDLENGLKKAIEATNRFSNISKDVFKDSDNTSRITLWITNIKYTHKGISKEGKSKGFSCQIQYNVLTNTSLATPQNFTVKEMKPMFASSSAFKYFSDKQSAFYGALDDFNLQVYKFIFKSTPFSLPVISIETDKKGKPEYITLQTPISGSLKRRKSTFHIVKKSSLTISDNQFKVGDVLAKITHRKSKYPEKVKVKIRGRKNKKILKNYIGKENELIGIGG